MQRFTINKEKKFPIRIPFSIILLVVAIFAFIIGINHISSSNEAEQMTILETSIERSITQCYALEGIYPPDLDYLMEHYGLTYDEERFFVDYQYIGSNLRPDITIIERKQDS